MNKNYTIFILFILIANTALFIKPRAFLDNRNERMGDSYPINQVVAKITQVAHNPIFISGDAAFTSANGVSGGTGTEQDPFIIANFSINGKGCVRRWHVGGVTLLIAVL